VGALTFVDFTRDRSLGTVERLLWTAYCAFHLGSFEQAQEAYIELLTGDYLDVPNEVSLFLACVYYNLKMYDEAQEAALEGPDSQLKHRILLHVAIKKRDDEMIVEHRRKLKGGAEDQLSHAAAQFLGGSLQDATDIYKRTLLENRQSLALNIYVAMCYFKMVRGRH